MKDALFVILHHEHAHAHPPAHHIHTYTRPVPPSFVSTNSCRKTSGDPIYLVKAQNHLSALLQADYYLPEATDGYQSILRRATAAWGDPEVGATFGDYFLLEAMVSGQ